MMWIDIVLKSFTAALTVIATWRAGSRAAYLMDHQRIGIMEGPVIQKPQWNETNPMFELSEAFRHCVRLSIQPFLYDNVHMEQKVTKVVEPYLSLSPRPYIPQASEEDKENKQQRSQEETTSSEESSSFSIKGILSVPAGAVKALFVVPYSGFKYTTNYLASTTNIAMYWTRRTLSWRPWKESNLEIIAGESGT